MCIGGDVRVRVLSSSGGQVRLGIEAPSDVAVHREEVVERIASANREAAALSPELLAALAAPPRGNRQQGDGK